MMPPAPGRFSITIDWPQRFDKFVAERARHDVDRAAGRERHEDAHRRATGRRPARARRRAHVMSAMAAMMVRSQMVIRVLPYSVMPGLDPGIHAAFRCMCMRHSEVQMDCRAQARANDGEGARR